MSEKIVAEASRKDKLTKTDEEIKKILAEK